MKDLELIQKYIKDWIEKSVAEEFDKKKEQLLKEFSDTIDSQRTKIISEMTVKLCTLINPNRIGETQRILIEIPIFEY